MPSPPPGFSLHSLREVRGPSPGELPTRGALGVKQVHLMGLAHHAHTALGCRKRARALLCREDLSHQSEGTGGFSDAATVEGTCAMTMDMPTFRCQSLRWFEDY